MQVDDVRHKVAEEDKVKVTAVIEFWLTISRRIYRRILG